MQAKIFVWKFAICQITLPKISLAIDVMKQEKIYHFEKKIKITSLVELSSACALPISSLDKGWLAYQEGNPAIQNFVICNHIRS